MTPLQYREFLVSRVFVTNGFGSVEALLAAIEAANQIDEHESLAPP
jgi:hypothetical protein